MHLGENGGLGIAGLGGLGDLQQQLVAADLEGRGVEAFGLFLTPVPDRVQHTQARSAETFALADAPVVLVGSGETGESGLDLGHALLFEPLHPAQPNELAREQVAQGGQVPDVECGVIEHLLGERTARPVGLLRFLGKLYPEVVLEQRSQADARTVQELRGEHGVEDALGPESAEVVQQAQVEIAAVHDNVFFGQPLPESVEGQPGERVDEVDLVVHQKLEEAEAGLVMEHVVRLGIEGDFVHAVESRKQRGELAGLIDELIGRHA